MRFPRQTGVLLHPTSLPSAHGIGDFGAEAYRFVDFLQEAGIHLWQVLPLSPTGYGDSPFQCLSASAGNPLLVSLDKLAESGALVAGDLQSAVVSNNGAVDYESVIRLKAPLLTKAAHTFLQNAGKAESGEYEQFCQANERWLDDFALFMVSKNAHHGAPWTEWSPDIAAREPGALAEWTARFRGEIEVIQYCQFEFFRQWSALRSYANERDIRIVGDIPIYVAHDSADVWSHRAYFLLDENGRPTRVAGVPPDYFSATGQLWGNPIYNWPVHRTNAYRWWLDRFRAAFTLYDVVRIDHFRGFEAHWEVGANETTAEHGHWVKGPGAELFSALQEEFGDLPIIAENLGVITPEVEHLLEQFDFPGMAILQFAFGKDPQGPTFRPHNYVRNLAAYTGTHDNDTVVGWWASRGANDSTRTPDDIVKEHAFAKAYLGLGEEPINRAMIRTLLASVADTAILPLQDILGLGSEARMNLPGTSSGNWRWRFRREAIDPELTRYLRELNNLYDR